ncbi:FMN-dependent NADH-azoreductase [Virgibacillus xinjiangensis]|uniref:FMN dependent NADH:quinone oxidoreductase n=1 Tax=Virgibacillus xinjiangensis TaxID=393090 RepID=A0ABV7CWA1_9BACI
MNILVVKANNRPEGISTKMYEAFMEQVKDNKDFNVSTFDIFEEEMPYFGQDLLNALGKLDKEEDMNEVEQKILAAKQRAKDAVIRADVLVFAFPLWNFTIPAKLQTFIDYIAEAGFSFKYDAEGNLVPLMDDKKIILLNARGGVYSAPEMAPMEMAVDYMRNILSGMFGMEVIDEVIIEGHNAMPEKAEEIVKEGLQRVSESASKLAFQEA